MAQESEKNSFAVNLGNHIASWYRISRILLSFFTALLIASAIGLPIFYAQIENGDASTLPYYLLVILAGGVYATAWWAFVGFDRDTENPSYGGAKAGWLALVGLITLILLIIEIILWVLSSNS